MNILPLLALIAIAAAVAIAFGLRRLGLGWVSAVSSAVTLGAIVYAVLAITNILGLIAANGPGG